MIVTKLEIPEADMNKTEARFATDYLEPRRAVGDLLWYAYEPLKLRLAGKTFYTPDFCAVDQRGALHAYEVKAKWTSGRWAGKAGYREDARVKIKVAAETYRWIRFHSVAFDRKLNDFAWEDVGP